MCVNGNIMTDEQLCELSKAGSSDAEHEIVLRYSRVVRMCARPYFLEGGDMEDLIQEGMFGLIKAIRDYSPHEHAAFRTYAQTCIRNRIYTPIKTALRNKHAPLNNSLSFDEEPGRISAGTKSLEDAFISSEKNAEFQESLRRSLSQLEFEVMELYLDGWSYQEIGEKLGRSSKAVDNAVQRIRRKISRAKSAKS